MRGVDVDCKEQGYEPDRAGDGVCKHVKDMFLYLAVGSGLAWGVEILNLQYIYPNVRNPVERWLSEGYSHVIFGFTVALWGLFFLQLITNGNLLKRSLQDATASAIVIAAFLYMAVRLTIGM